jgi:hypothetical protein
MHLPGEARRKLFALLASAVAPGGTLLIVGHHPSDLRTTAHRMHFPDMMFTAHKVASSLDPTALHFQAVGPGSPVRRGRRRVTQRAARRVAN